MSAWPFSHRNAPRLPNQPPPPSPTPSNASAEVPLPGGDAEAEDIFIPGANRPPDPPDAATAAPSSSLPPPDPSDLYVPEPPSAKPQPPPPPPEPPLSLPLVPTELEWVVPCDADRIDRLLAALYKELSRVRWQKLIEAGQAVTLNGKPVTENKTTVHAGDRIHCIIPPSPLQTLPPQDIPLDVHYEDDDILILAKQPGLVVHPAPGHEDGTLANALMNYLGPEFGQMDAADRPGLVHRLDKDTSGLLVIAKTAPAMRSLKEQFSEHTVHKEYIALVWGSPVPARGLYDAPIARHPVSRKKMAVSAEGRPARTLHTTLLAGPLASLQRIRIETGRTHQIRVHFSHDGHPVCGDTTYGRARPDIPRDILPRQMLHACRVRFIHPRTGDPIEFTLPPPADFLAAADALITPPGTVLPAPAPRDDLALAAMAQAEADAKNAAAAADPALAPLRAAWTEQVKALFPRAAATDPGFPTIGKMFSDHWKTRTEFFQSLEHAPIAGPDPVDTFPEVCR